jgi:ABC-type sugar transport system substrate-binding protein
VLKTLAGLLVAGAAEKVSIVLAEPSVPSALSPALQAASAAGEASETIGVFP